jgi:nucleotide-binding universal stress UspA family protein
MNRVFPPASIIVGVDGSKAAVRAAIWAVDEAVSRDIPLRLVHVIAPDANPRNHPGRMDREYARAEHVAHVAWTAVEATGKPVKIEMEILRGEPAPMLARASRSAAMVCVGWTGRSRSAEVGSTASALTRSAHCPVVVVRLRASASLGGQWVIARVDDSPSSDAVLHQAMEEARLRGAPLLALTTGLDHDEAAQTAPAVRMRLDLHLARLSADATDVSVCSLPIGNGVLEYLANNVGLAQLVVVGADDPHVVTELTGPHADSLLHHSGCSVMCVPGRLSSKLGRSARASGNRRSSTSSEDSCH